MRCVQYLLLHLAVVLTVPCWAEAVSADDSTAVLTVESPYGFEETIANLRRAIAGNNYRLIREQSWDSGLESGHKKGRDAILYFCNFDLVHQAIRLDRRVGQFLPCRVTVTEQAGHVLVMTVNPHSMGDLLDNPDLAPMCRRMEDVYQNLIEEAAL